MSDQSKLGLGQIITTEQDRDAIHCAVAPIIAAQRLSPVEHVAIEGGKAVRTGTKIGVVDPFLKQSVEKGEKFWMFLYPGSIKSLRHEWTHPAFNDEVRITVNTSKKASEEWMTEWAMRHMGDDYYSDEQRSPQDALRAAIEAGENMSVGPHEDARDHIDNEWWNHWEIITGKTGQRGEYFSCGC